ncbi:MAG: capsular polysaccharide biosynthesis protein [Alphaproteobacteria bacterium]|nr:capsular polysaccharide biosynthesis protein [Alphaproteobacteria bacterium]
MTSRPMLAMAHLSAFLGQREILALSRARECAAIAGWGMKWPARRGLRAAQKFQLPFLRIEDGFLRSAGLSKQGAPPVGLCIDAKGIYFDAHTASDLESLLLTAPHFSASTRARATAGLNLWRSEGLSKYNLPATGALPAGGQLKRSYKIIIADQVLGDASIAGAGANAETFKHMLDSALAHTDARYIGLRQHPDVAAGKARGYLATLARAKGLDWIDPAARQADVFAQCEEIWTVSSQIGFEALIAGRNVTTFAMPFYAGWGLTQDKAQGAVAEACRMRRQGECSLEELFAAALLLYTRYADPVTRQSVAFEQAAARIIDWRARLAQRGSRKIVCFGFPSWKCRICDVFLGAPDVQIKLHSHAATPARIAVSSKADVIAVWGAVNDGAVIQACAATQKPLWRIEDGFIRSVGRGSDLRMPGSLVIDDSGMYYDARQPSALETILQNADIGEDLIARARRLRERLLHMGVTKYNLGPALVDLAAAAGGRNIILVAAQVPGDAAIKFGTGAVNTNMQLLEAVRREHPHDFIVYKDHPDLAAGNRRGRGRNTDIAQHADMIVSEGDIASLFSQCNELHVMSSLAGFEALLRGVKVNVWGAPFYAGWGLTRDRMALPRRKRARSLDELTAAALILYPVYADPVSGIPCEVEDYLDSLEDLLARPRGKEPKGFALQLSRFGRWLTGRIAAGP